MTTRNAGQFRVLLKIGAVCALTALGAGCATRGVYVYPFDQTVGGARIAGQIAAGEGQAVADVAITGRLPISNETVQVSVNPDGTASVQIHLVVR